MGGSGSGRPPNVETLMKRSTPEITPIGNSLFLPNYSGVKPEAIKTNATVIANATESDPVFMSLSGALPYVATSLSGAWNTHIANNSQAHSDYMLNTGDTATGNYYFGTTFTISGANVGIGTTAPFCALNVQNTNNEKILLTDTESSGNYGLSLGFDDSSDTNAYIYNKYSGGSSRINFGFGPTYSASTTALCISYSSPNGKVGIGMTTPDQKLTCSGAIGLSNIAAPTLTLTASSGAMFVSGGALWYKGSAATQTLLAAA